MSGFDVVKAALVPLGYAVHIDRNPNDSGSTVLPPYLIISGPDDGRSDEEPNAGPLLDSASDMRITAVFGTTEGVRFALQAVLEVLSPGKQVTTLAPGVFTKFTRREVVDVDTSVVLTTGRHPGYGVDTYRLVTETV